MPRIGHDYSGFSYFPSGSPNPPPIVILSATGIFPLSFSPVRSNSSFGRKREAVVSFSFSSRRRISKTNFYSIRFRCAKNYPSMGERGYIQISQRCGKGRGCVDVSKEFERFLPWQVETRRGNKCREFLFGAKDFQINVFSERRVIKALLSFLRSCLSLSLCLSRSFLPVSEPTERLYLCA